MYAPVSNNADDLPLLFSDGLYIASLLDHLS